MRAHVSCTQELRSHVVIHINYQQGITMLTEILVYLLLIIGVTVSFLSSSCYTCKTPVPEDEDARSQPGFNAIVTQA